MRIKVNIFPSGGHFYKERDGAIIRGMSWKGVIARTLDYRKRNNFPEGDAEADVMAQACQRNPSLCYADETPQQKQQRKAISVKGRVLAWFSKLNARKADLEYVPKAEAMARADVCARCPRNVSIADGCSPCKRVIREYRQAIIADRDQDKRISSCSELGEDTVTTVWLDEQRVENAELPAECWRKRTV